MTTINGILECPLMDVGSKSEGKRAILTDDLGNTYQLYRSGVYPVNDEYFYQFIGMKVIVTGIDEPRTGNFLVESITAEENNTTDSNTEETVAEEKEETTDQEHTTEENN